MLAAFGGGLVVAGVALGFDGAVGRLRRMDVRAAGVAGLVARYPPADRRGRYGAGLVAGGFLLLAGAELLVWALRSVEPRSGALSYPPLGLELVGTIALAAGSVLLGWTLLGRDAAPRWLGPLLLVAGLLAVPSGVVAHQQYAAADGLYGLAWVVACAHVATARPHSVSSSG